MRDTKTYCGILLDDNNRKPIIRLRFNSTNKKRIGIIENKQETKYPIDGVNDIFDYAEQIKATVSEYLETESAVKTGSTGTDEASME
jgi:hypothetical protein